MRIKQTMVVLALAGAVAAPAATSAQVVTRVVTKRGWLGINYDIRAERHNGHLSETMTVLDVVTGSPADKAGVRKGDRIVRIDGKALSMSKFEAITRALQPGDTVRLRVAGNGRERDLALVAAERPAQYGVTDELILVRPDSIRRMVRIFMDSARIRVDSMFADSTFVRRLPGLRYHWRGRGDSTLFFFRDSLGSRLFELPSIRAEAIVAPHFELLTTRMGVAGAEFTQLNAGLSHYFGTSRGLLVLRVAPGTPSAQAGLEAGDVLTRTDGAEIENVEQLRRAVTRARDGSIKLEIVRKGRAQMLTLDLKRR